MDKLKIMRWTISITGLAIIAGGFLTLASGWPTDILVLNTAVASTVFLLITQNFFTPMTDRTDPAQPQIASMGVRWCGTGIYGCLATATILFCNINGHTELKYQLILQAALLFLLIVFITLAMKTSDQASRTHHEERAKHDGVQQMRTAMRNLTEAAASARNIPAEITHRIDQLQQELRFISPAMTDEAADYERQFCTTVRDVAYAMDDYAANADSIRTGLDKAFHQLNNRKAVYSN